jgi:hypothetical protein
MVQTGHRGCMIPSLGDDERWPLVFLNVASRRT